MESSFSELDIVLRIFISVIVGASIGYEREIKNRPAGLRTHVLVCIGACVVSLIQEELRKNSLQLAMIYPNINSLFTSDLGRYGAQVISGVGFLGAGAIMKEKRKIMGLTTAATLWVTACIGISVGWGMYFISIISTFLVIIILATFKKLKNKI
ncbi:MgtC/SapB family protein [Fusobacterium sp. MFO224]|uniref:MgtC/SapB family protein n=1 Tax=Fusobacterium sp. MFO224 TaxID=3378070 RepID=UPI003855667F